MSKKTERIEAEVIALEAALQSEKLTPYEAKSVLRKLAALSRQLDSIAVQIDAIRNPSAVFDPSEPKVVGRFVSLALVAQDRVDLAGLAQAYGSGVYAIYYNGPFELYAPIANTETPIYVGQASPSSRSAKTPREQGAKLTGRLLEHAANINRATNLKLDDFQCRHLAVQTGWETAAEDYLIHLFEPIWNSETRLVYGIGKHGDSSSTRANKRSPWDTLHPGRTWAATSTHDAKSLPQISSELDEHFRLKMPFKSVEDVLREFISELKQH